MELDTSFVGMELKEYRCRAEWRHTTNFAASLHSSFHRYYDDTEGHLAVHPVFPTALTWPVIQNIKQYIPENFPFNVFLTQVHYTEHIEHHRPVIPGQELVIKGLLASLEPRRSGTHGVIMFKAYDQEGREIFTEYIGALFRGVTCREERSVGVIPHSPERDEGAEYQSSQIFIDRYLPFVYDGCSDIVFPIHTSQRFAREVGLPGRILQGTATLALAINNLLDTYSITPSQVKNLGCRFTGMVLPESDISIETARSRDDVNILYFNVLNHQGQKAISQGYVEMDTRGNNNEHR